MFFPYLLYLSYNMKEIYNFYSSFLINKIDFNLIFKKKKNFENCYQVNIYEKKTFLK